MASQIAEREDHVVVEDVRGETKTDPIGCIPLAPRRRFRWSSRARQGGLPGLGAGTVSLLRELLT